MLPYLLKAIPNCFVVAAEANGALLKSESKKAKKANAAVRVIIQMYFYTLL